MPKALWLLTRTIALSVIVDVGVAAAQTVIVRGAPPGAPVEVLMDGGSPRSATADTNGDASVPVAMPAGNAEAAVQVFVDRCDPLVRVQLVRRGVPVPPAAAGCRRGEASGAFLMRAITTFLVEADVGGGTVYVRQGPVPRTWLAGGDEGQGGGGGAFQGTVPTGVTLWAGGGISRDNLAVKTVCGEIADCSGDAFSGALGAGATYWVSRLFGVQAAVAQRGQATAEGSGDGYHFSTAIDTRLLTLTAVAGGSVRAIRLYAQGGVDRHRATFRTTQSADDRTVTVDNATQTLAGGTQTLEYTTEGWGWVVGGGLEAWVNRVFGLYADAQYVKLRGSDVTGGEARTNESLLVVTAGIRVHLGR